MRGHKACGGHSGRDSENESTREQRRSRRTRSPVAQAIAPQHASFSIEREGWLLYTSFLILTVVSQALRLAKTPSVVTLLLLIKTSIGRDPARLATITVDSYPLLPTVIFVLAAGISGFLVRGRVTCGPPRLHLPDDRTALDLL